jgi:hypothetical protein
MGCNNYTKYISLYLEAYIYLKYVQFCAIRVFT